MKETLLRRESRESAISDNAYCMVQGQSYMVDVRVLTHQFVMICTLSCFRRNFTKRKRKKKTLQLHYIKITPLTFCQDQFKVEAL